VGGFAAASATNNGDGTVTRRASARPTSLDSKERRMSRKDLKQRLKNEIATWEARPYLELASLGYPVVYETGRRGEKNYYNTEVTLLEREATKILLSISIDDGGLSAFVPVSGSVVVTAR
jgi:hypothetical protein